MVSNKDDFSSHDITGRIRMSFMTLQEDPSIYFSSDPYTSQMSLKSKKEKPVFTVKGPMNFGS